MAGIVLVCATLATYGNSLGGAFIFDDLPAIPENASIRQLWPLTPVLSPPAHSTVTGRPLVNLTLALNHAIGGLHVGGYHTVNLGIHLAAGLVLFGVIRRTLLQPALGVRWREAALPLGFGAALLWMLHPLQTESVAYVAQRAESLMGLLYLLALYGFIRGTGTAAPKFWFTLALTACLLGMATKEVMVTAPLMILLYDRTFIAGSFRSAWRQHGKFHLGLAGTWLLLGYLVLGAHNRGGSAGFGVGGTWWDYALTQVEAVPHYLRLTFWPRPLVFDYGMDLAKPASGLFGPALVLLGLLAGTTVALRRWPAVGFAGAWFFVILAPTSSVMAVASQTVAEHRVYLSLAAPLVLITVGLHRLIGYKCLLVLLPVAAGLGWLTAQRNEDYRSALSIWSDTVAKRPDNPRAQDSLGVALASAGRVDEAVPHFLEAVRLTPNDAKLHSNLGNALALQGRSADAVREFQAALRLKPDYAEAWYNLGLTLDQAGRRTEAMTQYEQALRLKPDYVDAHFNLGCILAQQGRSAEAIPHFEFVSRLRPNDAETLSYLAQLRAQQKAFGN